MTPTPRLLPSIGLGQSLGVYPELCHLRGSFLRLELLDTRLKSQFLPRPWSTPHLDLLPLLQFVGLLPSSEEGGLSGQDWGGLCRLQSQANLGGSPGSAPRPL